MDSLTFSWESDLLSLAQEAYNVVSHTPMAHFQDRRLLKQAYQECDRLTSVHSRSFYMASGLLPAGKREAVRALYAFCRVSDDIVDRASGSPQEMLANWRGHTLTHTPPRDNLVALAWADARHRYRIPVRYAEQLLDGVARDLHQKRYERFDDLAAYAYGVASTVGLMSMHIIGFSGPTAIPYAIKLGVALQLTNILRDVGEDWANGRVYLPQEELRAFGLDERDLASGRVTDQWRWFMRFQIERNRQLYEEARPGIAMLERDGRLAIAAAAEMYRAILDDIEAHDYDVFGRRAHLTGWDKLRMLPGLWWRTR